MMTNVKNRKIRIVILLCLMVGGLGYFYYTKYNDPMRGFTKYNSTTITGNTATIMISSYQGTGKDTVQFYFDGKLIFDKLPLMDSAINYNTGKLSKGEHWIGVKALTNAEPHVNVDDGVSIHGFNMAVKKDSAASWVIIVP